MSFKRKNPGNQSIRRQLTFYMGLFVVLPLCLALMLLNFYLQKVTTENKINNETGLLSQIRDNTDQMIEVTNYATSMLMTNKNTLKNLRILEQDGDSYEIYQAKRELSNDISDVESSVLNAVGGKVVILTKKGYMIGSYTLSKTETNYEKEQWYQEILENGRKITYSTGIETMFQEMTIHDNIQKYFYMGREILDYSGKNLGIMLIRLSEKKIWGKLAASMVTEEGGALYILDRNNDILMGYNEKYQKQLKELKEQEIVKEISDNEITWFTGMDNYDEGIAFLQKEYPNLKLICLSMGGDGSKAVYRDIHVAYPAFLQEATIETTGAGDTFCACMIHTVLENGINHLDEEKLKEMLKFANAAASLVTTKKGALRVMPTKEEVETFIENFKR